MMKKFRKFLATPAVNITVFALALVLLGSCGIGGARAALIYDSDFYRAQMQLQQIQVQLVHRTRDTDEENPQRTQWEKVAPEWNGKNGPQCVLGTLTEETPQPGKVYPQQLAVQNPTDDANIYEYVRVTIRRYWEGGENNGETLPDEDKNYSLDPDMIELLLNGEVLGTSEAATVLDTNNWVEDKVARTDERIVLYYTSPIAPGSMTQPFADSVRINGEVSRTVTQETVGGTVTTTYLYDNAQAVLEITVDAVQNHDAQAAILSAWGRKVTIGSEVDANGEPFGTLNLA